ncbi:hypothetical protein GH733_006351 [Mirounga leonina]|nr:hypothetical protein GH733_006351 [Mirounga leonina]
MESASSSAETLPSTPQARADPAPPHTSSSREKTYRECEKSTYSIKLCESTHLILGRAVVSKNDFVNEDSQTRIK